MKRKIYTLLINAKQGLFALALLVSGLVHSQQTYTFSYTGGQQTINIPAGPYKIECWGANGADGTYYSAMSPNNLIDGGKGGYSTGTITVNSPTIWYINVGGKGSNTNTGNNPGGYNGGGNSSSAAYQAGSGGGASHVATASGILSSLSSNQSAVLIVAGGGGGGGNQSLGGDGGGLNGIQPAPSTQFSNRTAGGGGSQTSGGSCYSGGSGAGFGQGGTTTQNLAGGGGGGWYGGCTGDNSTAGGGGSGYIGGVSSGTTAAMSQPGFTANPDVSGNGLVIITGLCDVTIGSSSNPVCQGSSITLTTNAITTLSWSASASTGTSIVVAPTTNTTYYVTGTGPGNCVTTAAINLSMTPLPNVSSMVNPPLLCVGNTATLTGQGANTYTWSNSSSGTTTAVSPSVTTIYTVTGTNGFGCVNFNTVSVVVNSNSIGVPASTTICQGTMINIIASGAISYTWSNGFNLSGFIASPTVNTVYSVLGTDVNNCLLSNSVSVNVNPLPNVFASSDKDVICKKESVTLTASGANSYAWTSSPITGPLSGASVVLTLNIDVPYLFTVTGTDANGCTNTSTVAIDVQKCSGVGELSGQNNSVSVYPNPNNGIFTVESKQITSGEIHVIDLTGKIVFKFDITDGKTLINMTSVSNGIYYLRIGNNNSFEMIKLVKNNN